MPEGDSRRAIAARMQPLVGDAMERPVIELGERRMRRFGPDILDRPAPVDELLVSLRAARQDRAIGEALLDQRVVAGIGNLWRSELSAE